MSPEPRLGEDAPVASRPGALAGAGETPPADRSRRAVMEDDMEALMEVMIPSRTGQGMPTLALEASQVLVCSPTATRTVLVFV